MTYATETDVVNALAKVNALPLGSYGGAVHVLDQAHQKIHDGLMYVAYKFASVTGAGEYVRIAVRPPATSTGRMHVTVEAQSTAPAVFAIKEGVTPTGGANATPVNLNRNSANVSFLPAGDIKSGHTGGTSLTHTGGTELKAKPLADGWVLGGQAKFSREWHLKAGVWTVIEITNTGAVANTMDLELFWYETE